MSASRERRLVRHGFVLLLLGLLTGFAVPAVRNPHLGVAAHLIGVVDGVFLVTLAWAWRHFDLSDRGQALLYGCALYGTYVGWAGNLASGVFGTSRMTPIGGAGFHGTPWQENLVTVCLVSVALSLVVMCVIALVGLRGRVAAGPVRETGP